MSALGYRTFLKDTEGFYVYSKCSKILNTFFYLFSNKILLIRAGNRKMFLKIANREDPDLTTSPEAI